MSFISSAGTYASAQLLMDAIADELVLAGWTIVENYASAAWSGVHANDATKWVYKSAGETGNEIDGYIYGSISSNTITLMAYGYWDTATHAGNCLAFDNSSYDTVVWSSSSQQWCCSGDKDIFVVYEITMSDGNTKKQWWGHLPMRCHDTPLATFANAESAGASVVVEVDNTDDFKINKYYQVMGCAGEGRELAKVTAVVDATSLTLETLAYSYAAGAKIGVSPYVFGISSGGDEVNFSLCTARNVAGTDEGTSTPVVGTVIPIEAMNPDDTLGTGTGISGLWLLSPIYIWENLNTALLGFVTKTILQCGTTTLNYLFGISASASPISGTASSATNNTLTLTGAGWTEDVYAGKEVLIADGTGVKQTRKIASNTSDTLTVSLDWFTNPNGTSIFYIVDEVYRSIGGKYYAVKEAY